MATVGSVPPSSMHSMSLAVIPARWARSATLRPRATRSSYKGFAEGQGPADRDPHGVVGLNPRALPADVLARTYVILVGVVARWAGRMLGGGCWPAGCYWLLQGEGDGGAE